MLCQLSDTSPWLSACLQVDTISTSQLLDGSWVHHAALLVMPGGADLPYCKHFNGRGNSIIKGKLAAPC
jgi:biotin--protein ligase